jgi:hypothetical protein
MYIIIIVVLIVALALLASFGDQLPAQYVRRACQGFAWRRRFPTSTQNDIRGLLRLFVNFFAFKEKPMLRFSPGGEILQVYSWKEGNLQ